MKIKNFSFLKIAYSFAVYAFFYIPIIVVIALSFNNSNHSLLWHGFTLKWYKYVITDYSILISAVNSLTVSFCAATLATIIGTVLAINLFRYRFWGKKFINGLIFVMVIIPEIVIGISLLLLYSFFHCNLGFWTLLLAHVTLIVPFIAIPVYSRVTTMDRNIIAAAKDLGADDFTIFRRILIPLLLPAILSGWLLGFTLSLDDVIISYFVTGPEFSILPLKIYSMVRMGVKPEINALCTIMFIFTLLMVVISQFFMKKKYD